jgi:hypothetical protein
MDKVKQQYRAYTAAHKALKTAKTKAEREPLEAEKEANRKAFRQYVVAREKRRALRKERGASVGA